MRTRSGLSYCDTSSANTAENYSSKMLGEKSRKKVLNPLYLQFVAFIWRGSCLAKGPFYLHVSVFFFYFIHQLRLALLRWSNMFGIENARNAINFRWNWRRKSQI